MGPEGRGVPLTWRSVGEVLRGTSGPGRGHRRGRGSPGRGRVPERKEAWRTAERATLEVCWGGGGRAVKHRAVRTWEACSQGDPGLGGDGSTKVDNAVSLESTKRYVAIGLRSGTLTF